MNGRLRLFWLLALLAVPVHGAVVINEIFYHSPDDWDDLQWVELHNTDKEPADIGGWSLAKGVKLKFPSGTTIPAEGYLVVCRKAALFKQFYQVAPAFEFDRSMSHKGEKIELRNRKKEVVDSVKFSHEAPWPLIADGMSSSLERICPAAPGDDPHNWAASPPSPEYDRPLGSPGAKNASYSATLPPVIESVRLASEIVEAGKELEVAARMASADSVEKVDLIYRVASPGRESDEKTVPMAAKADGEYLAKVPSQEPGSIIRVRVIAKGKDGSTRSSPSENDLRPAKSAWVKQTLEPSKLSQLVVIQSNPARIQRNDFGGPSPEDQARWQRKGIYRVRLNLIDLWASLAFTNELKPGQFPALSKAFANFFDRRNDAVRALDENDSAVPSAANINKEIELQQTNVVSVLTPLVSPEQMDLVRGWLRRSAASREVYDQDKMLKNWVGLEEFFFRGSVFGGIKEASLGPFRDAFLALAPKRAELRGLVNTAFQNDENRQQFQARVEKVTSVMNEKLGTFTGDGIQAASQKMDEASIFRVRPQNKLKTAPRERTALVSIDPATQKATLYDFVRIVPRKAGWKIHFPKDVLYRDMSTINVIYEFNDRFVLAEPLAFELYRRSGNEACLTDFVRLTLDGQPMGYHLLCEQPNKAFLRRIGLRDDGNMYKADWHGDDIPSRNEKKTHVHETHEDLIDIVRQLDNSQGEEQWKIIRKNFDVEQVAAYFAINMLMSHWDGYFNNYFAYHDIHGTGKWTVYPWDQDKTMGIYDGLAPNRVFTTLPLTFGMKGDLPPGWNQPYAPRSFMDVINIPNITWWRQPGYFSGPLLANPKFRAVYLGKIKELLDTEFSEAKMRTAIDRLDPLLREEVRLHAKVRGEDPRNTEAIFDANLDSLRRFVTGRREYLLKQPELQKAGPIDRSQF